jgi:hypothetical protein
MAIPFQSAAALLFADILIPERRRRADEIFHELPAGCVVNDYKLHSQ